MNDESDPEAFPGDKQAVVDNMRYHCQRASETDNALHYLSALRLAIADSTQRALADVQYDPTSRTFANLVRTALERDRTLVLPGQLCEYLDVVLRWIAELARGLDFRDFPKHSGNEGPDQVAWDEYVTRKRYGGQPLSSEKAASLVPQALGLTKPGRNAFKLALQERLAQQIQWAEHHLRAQGFTAEQAKDHVMSKLGRDDERSYRRLKKGTRRRGGKLKQ